MDVPRAAFGVLVLLVAGCTSPEVPGDDASPPESTSPVVQTGTATQTTGATTSTSEPSAGRTAYVEILDVGQGDAFVMYSGDYVGVFDTGRWTSGSYGVLVDRIKALGFDHIDDLLISHPDADHAGGCQALFAEFQVYETYTPGSSSSTQSWQECEQAMAAEPDHVLWTDDELNAGHTIALADDWLVTILWIDQTAGDVNDGSLTVIVDYGSTSVLFPGDLGCPQEASVLAGGIDVDVDLLVAGHHGSKTSTCASWLEATSPDYVFVSSAYGSQHGHPDKEVIDRLAAASVPWYWTGYHGTLTVTMPSQGPYTIAAEWGQAALTADPRPAPSSTTTTSSSTTTTTATSNPSGGVAISSTQFDTPTNPENDNLDQEWVQITNGDGTGVDMTGWTLQDEAGTTYHFPGGFTLDAGASVKVRTGTGTNTATDLYWGRSQAVWNNDGDTAYLYNGGTLVDQRSG